MAIVNSAVSLLLDVAVEPEVLVTLSDTLAVLLVELSVSQLSWAVPAAASARLSVDLKEIGNRMARMVRVRRKAEIRAARRQLESHLM